MERAILSGNEAIARGAYEAGVKVASAYPGTPSTEILENMVQYPSIDASWAPNEKVALETAFGAAIMGARSLCYMKHLGLAYAGDPLGVTIPGAGASLSPPGCSTGPRTPPGVANSACAWSGWS